MEHNVSRKVCARCCTNQDVAQGVAVGWQAGQYPPLEASQHEPGFTKGVYPSATDLIRDRVKLRKGHVGLTKLATQTSRHSLFFNFSPVRDGKKAHSLDLFCNIESAEISWLLLTPYKTFNAFWVAP